MTNPALPRRFATLALLLLALPLAGCAAIKATEQPSKKNLSVLSPGSKRTHVIAELGAPTWSDERETGATDVFTFKQGYAKETKAARALAHGAADVATLGLWEVVGIPFESIADGTDVQLEVHYGADQRVTDVHVIKGDHVVNPKPTLLARAFGGKHTRPEPAVSKSAPRAKVHSPEAVAAGDAPEVVHASAEVAAD